MKMKEMVAAPPTQLHLPTDHMSSSNCSTPYMSAASSPQRPRPRPRPPQLDFFFYSAPTSPRSSSSYLDDHFDEDVAVLDRDYATDHVPLLSHRPSSSATVPFNWELKPGVAKTATCSNEDGHQPQKLGGKEQSSKDEFEFDFSGQLDMMVRPSLSSADELFDGGKIRPLKLKPPPRLHTNSNHPDNWIGSDSHSPKSPTSKFKDALRRKGSEKQDPFEAALRNTRKSDSGFKEADNVSQDRGRGRGRVNTNTNTNTNTNMNTSKRGGNSGRKGISRSLSPLRVSEFALLQHQQYLEDQKNSNETSNNNCSRLLGRIPSSSTCSSKKWKLKDLLLFRSASEGHYKDTQSFSKRWSFRSSTAISSGSVTDSGSGSVSKRRGQGASAHEMHYATNKAASEEMKRKTSLPYKHGLLACLGFSPILPQFSYTFPSPPSTPLSY